MKAIQTLVFSVKIKPESWASANWHKYHSQFRSEVTRQRREIYPDSRLYTGNVEITQMSFVTPDAEPLLSPFQRSNLDENLIKSHTFALAGILYINASQVTNIWTSEVVWGDEPGTVIVITGEVEIEQPLPDLPDDWQVSLMDPNQYPNTNPRIYTRSGK